MRRETISFKVRDIGIGSFFPVSLQSMTNTDTLDVETTLEQIKRLATNGAELVRVAVPTRQHVDAALEIARQSRVPIIGDIHFDAEIAERLMRGGIDGIRINPGNLGGVEKMRTLIKTAKQTDTAVRVGVNSGSVQKDLLKKYGGPTAEAMVESLASYVAICEEEHFTKIVLSVKASSVPVMIKANQLAAKQFNYPLHLGVTEAGSMRSGIIKSSVGIGCLLAEGIGDTIRISLTGDPVAELPVGKGILKALDLRKEGVDIIACPTCGRTQIALSDLLENVEKMCEGITKPLKVAVMGCVVNGPGEAREADIGIAGGKGNGIIFKHGEVIAQVSEDKLLETFEIELAKLLEEDR